jgi:hypothetical protein
LSTHGFQVKPQNFVSGHRPTELVARDAAGQTGSSHA